MGLFTKKLAPTSSVAPLYTIGGQKTLLIVGLGNPGEEYAQTRHNAGAIAVASFHNAHPEFDKWVHKKDLHCLISSGILGSVRVLLVQPTTFMNNSGQAVQAVQRFYKVTNQETIVVYDELDIDFGTLRTRLGGGDAGHNGVKSVIAHIGADFGRVRIGIKSEHASKLDSADFVLKNFAKAERAQLTALNREVENILMEAIYAGTLSSETRSFLV